jgi:cyanophycin synthetase
VLVFGCGSSLDELLDAIRPTSPATASRIEAGAV